MIEKKECKWTVGNHPCETECGHAFTFEEGGPKENGAEYCLFCGGKLVEEADEDGEQ